MLVLLCQRECWKRAIKVMMRYSLGNNHEGGDG
jgi:hypothetical protein